MEEDCADLTQVQFTNKFSLAGYWILKKCRHLPTFHQLDVVFQPVLKISLFLGNHYFWMFGFSICALLFCGIMIICSSCFSVYIKVFLHICKIQQEQRFYHFDAASVCRQIQCLAGMMNEIQQNLLLLVMSALMFG